MLEEGLYAGDVTLYGVPFDTFVISVISAIGRLVKGNARYLDAAVAEKGILTYTLICSIDV
jgi:hypothetical protein